MGKVFYDMGFLSFVEVIECSASDLVAQYVGQTGPKTRSLLEKALGKVLFIDEAYRLGEGHFASEAIEELIDIITKPKFFGKVVIILAGYDEDMNNLMAVNTGLSSRFSEEIIFCDMNPDHCLRLLDRSLQKKSIDVAALRNHNSIQYQEMIHLLRNLSRLPFWGNARDVQTLTKRIVGCAFKAMNSPTMPLALTPEEVLDCMRTMLAEREEKRAKVPTRGYLQSSENSLMVQDPPPTTPLVTRTVKDLQDTPLPKEQDLMHPHLGDGRDVGVSDEVWNQLEADKKAAGLASKLSREAALERQQKLEQAQEIEKPKQPKLRHLHRSRRRTMPSSTSSTAKERKPGSKSRWHDEPEKRL